MCLTLVTPWTVALQFPLSMGFSRQEYWSGLPFLSSGILPNPGIEPRSPALQADCTLTELQVKLPLDCLICLLRNLYAGQEAAVRTRHGPTHWFQVGKGVCLGCTLSSCLLNLYAEYIMWNSGLDEAQAGIKIARRNINNLRYEDDTTLLAESKEELKSLLMRVKTRVKKLA